MVSWAWGRQGGLGYRAASSHARAGCDPPLHAALEDDPAAATRPQHRSRSGRSHAHPVVSPSQVLSKSADLSQHRLPKRGSGLPAPTCEQCMVCAEHAALRPAAGHGSAPQQLHNCWQQGALELPAASPTPDLPSTTISSYSWGALLGVQRPKSKELPASKPLAFLCILKRVISVEHRCTQISASQASMEIYGSVD